MKHKKPEPSQKSRSELSQYFRDMRGDKNKGKGGLPIPLATPSAGPRPSTKEDRRNFQQPQPSSQDRPHKKGKYRPEKGEKNRKFSRDSRDQESRHSPRSHERRPERRPDRSAEKSEGIWGTVDKNSKGFAFVALDRGVSKKSQKDVFVPPFQAQNLFSGDRVKIHLNHRKDFDRIDDVQRRMKAMVGRFHHGKKMPVVIYERRRAREEIPCIGEYKNAKEGDWVMADLEFPSKGKPGRVARIRTVYGEKLPPEADIAMVAGEHNLTEFHSEAALNEAKRFTLDVEKELNSDPFREDFRQIPLITIDGETARDFDDAVYVERAKSGYRLYVGIADVSYYVRPGTALDREAADRATSVYFPERAFHMLPSELSENLCSLKPNEPRLSMVAILDYDYKGNLTNKTVHKGVILSRRRATYTEIQKEWEANKNNKQWEFLPHFELYKILLKARSDKGSLDFELPEAEVKVKPTGEPISIEVRPRLDAHRLIECFMIAANEAVSEWAIEKKAPFVFRVHDEPSVEALSRFQELARNLGAPLKLNRDALSHSLKEYIKTVHEHPASALLNQSLLRSMAQAKYQIDNLGHFGLASTAYTHFTSPIRRYPDLLVHRVLTALIEKKTLPTEQQLASVLDQCNFRERQAADAERDSIRMKQLRIMEPHLGKEFPARVNGVMERGIFAQIDSPFVEGVIPADLLEADGFSFAEKQMEWVSRKGKKHTGKLKVGDRIKVQVAKVDYDLRSLDLKWSGAWDS